MENKFESFIVEVKSLTGIDLSLYKERQMKRRIESLISKNGYLDYPSYFAAMKRDSKILEQFLRHITINVSEFYRNDKHWEVLETVILPYLLEKNKNLKIWSAACSTGDEPYSLVMLLSKFMPISSITILATDIDDDIIAKAKMGVYNSKSLESLPKEYLNKYFRRDEDNYIISDEIKSRVTFKKHNLLADEYPKNTDLIVCRNVMIYFTEEAKEKIYANFNRALKKDGVLFVGSTEQMIMCNKYNFSSLKTFFYKKDAEM